MMPSNHGVLLFSMAKPKAAAAANKSRAKPAAVRKPPARQAKSSTKTAVPKNPTNPTSTSERNTKANRDGSPSATGTNQQNLQVQAEVHHDKQDNAGWETAFAALSAETAAQISSLTKAVTSLSEKLTQNNVVQGALMDTDESVGEASSVLGENSDHGSVISSTEQGEFRNVPVKLCDSHYDNVPKFSPGLSAGATVKHDFKLKIWANKFIEFYDLVYPNKRPEYSMSFSGDGTPQLLMAPRKRKLLSEVEWGIGCDVYTSVYTQRYPEQLEALLTYSRHVKELMKMKADWRGYDEEYRRAREFSPYSFYTVRQDLELKAFSQALVAPASSTEDTQGYGNNTRVPNGYCFTYHRRGAWCQAGDNCKWKHECPKCDQRHPMHRECRRFSENSNGQREPAAQRNAQGVPSKRN